jgi:hypothetical protein
MSRPDDPVLEYSEIAYRVALSDHADFGTLQYVSETGAQFVVTDNTRGGNALALALEIQRQLGILRMVAPRGFFTVEGEAVRTTRGDGNRRPADRRLPLPGTLLNRKWKGRTLLVEVLSDGFRFENRRYASLSAVAVAVTGTRWNGLAFFGLTGKRRKEQHRAEE